MLRIQSSVPAVPESVRLIRHAVADLAAAAGVGGEQLDAIRLAVSEAATNTVLYAYEADEGEIHATAELASDELWVLIADDGRGIHAGPESRGLGLGLALMSEVCDDFSVVERAGDGTELQLRFKIRAPAEGPRQDPWRESRSSATDPPSSTFSTMTYLAADDHATGDDSSPGQRPACSASLTSRNTASCPRCDAARLDPSDHGLTSDEVGVAQRRNRRLALTRPSAGATNGLLGASDHSVSESYPAQPDAVPTARAQIGDFALAAGIGGEALHAIRLAVSEAVTNAVRHAYRGRAGLVYVTAASVRGEFVVLVSDDGCGYQTPAETPGFGWGLAVIADATDEFVITERGGGGTEVRMRFRVAATQSTDAQVRGSIASATTPA